MEREATLPVDGPSKRPSLLCLPSAASTIGGCSVDHRRRQVPRDACAAVHADPARPALVLAIVAGAVAAGCVGPLQEPDPARDGRATILVLNGGPAASAALRDEDGATVWAARLLEGEGDVVEVAVRVDGCGDFVLLAGYNGTEPDAQVLLIAPCDYDLDTVRAEFRPPAWYRPPGERDSSGLRPGAGHRGRVPGPLAGTGAGSDRRRPHATSRPSGPDPVPGQRARHPGPAPDVVRPRTVVPAPRARPRRPAKGRAGRARGTASTRTACP